MRQGRPGPIHWFAVTNSSDAGIGDGTFNTNSMLKLLGRQDVMPNVAKNVRLEELEAERKRISSTNIRGTLGIPAPLDKTTEARLKKLDEQIAAHKKAVEEVERKIERRKIFLSRKKIVSSPKN